MITEREAVQVISRAAIFDQRMAKPSPAVIDGWADEFNRYDLELHDLLAGVSAYYEIGRERVIQPGDVIRAARDIRQRRALTETTDHIRALPPGAPAHYEHGGLNADGRPVQAAYEIDGAGHLPCPTCHAKPGEWCENTRTSNPKKIPHASRLTAAWNAAGRPKGRQL